MSRLQLWLRLLALSVLLGVVTHAGPRQEPTIPTLQSLKELGEFAVTLSGQRMASFPSEQPCLYSEWAIGTKRGDEWVERLATHHAGTPLHVVTPQGPIELRHGQVRLYVAPGAARHYSRADAATAPEIVRDLLAEHAALTLEEVVLTAGTTYYARVDAEGYLLPPPSPDSPPKRQQNLVLSISDRPFKGGKPQRPLAPSFIGIVY
jgi:hypothetical protein